MYIILLIHLISICTGFLDILPHKNILSFDILLLGDPKTVFLKSRLTMNTTEKGLICLEVNVYIKYLT